MGHIASKLRATLFHFGARHSGPFDEDFSIARRRIQIGAKTTARASQTGQATTLKIAGRQSPPSSRPGTPSQAPNTNHPIKTMIDPEIHNGAHISDGIRAVMVGGPLAANAKGPL